jgi:hypothetical protein
MEMGVCIVEFVLGCGWGVGMSWFFSFLAQLLGCCKHHLRRDSIQKEERIRKCKMHVF